MNTLRTCPQCQQPLPEDAPEGLCPQCLMKELAGATNILPPGSTPSRDTVDIGDAAEVAKRLPQFEIIELLGRGGMGVVYKARQVQLDRLVALKILPPEDSRSPDFVERFRREARSLAKLSHPNIVNVYDFGEGGGLYYIVMEFVEGANLRQLIQSKQLSAPEALAIVPKICDALQYAHEEGVMHRDIKPENILVDKKGRVKIADFGLAKLLHRDPTEALLTRSGVTLGTPRYMAPEQVDKPETVDHRADIYSLGVVFYEMLTGEVPMGRFAPPSQKVQIDVKLDEIVLHAMERDVERRYQHVSEIKTDVEKVTSKPMAPVAPPTPPASATPRPTFARSVINVMIGPACVWLACLFFDRDYSYIVGMCMLLNGVPLALFLWRRKEATRGLHWRQLPPAVRLRGKRRIIPITAACAAVFLAGEVFFPSRTTEWREEWFHPKSLAYEKLALAGNITGYHIPFWSKSYVAGSGTVALKIYRKDSTPAALTFTLPGLSVENDSHDPGQPPGVLTPEVLTNWLRDSVRLDVAQPQVQAEARQLMELLEPYHDVAPPSWDELSSRAVTVLHDFKLGGYTTPLARFGLFGSLFFALLAFPAVCFCLYYVLLLPVLKRSYAEGRVEIEAGRWTPPKLVVVRIPLAFWALFLLGAVTVALAFQGRFQGETGALVVILLSLGVLMVIIFQLHWRRQIQQARAEQKGLWPQLGELPTLEHVKRLAQAGEKILAIKLYRQIHGASLADAKAAVENLVIDPQPVVAPPVSVANEVIRDAAGTKPTQLTPLPRFFRLRSFGALMLGWVAVAASWNDGLTGFVLGSVVMAAILSEIGRCLASRNPCWVKKMRALSTGKRFIGGSIRLLWLTLLLMVFIWGQFQLWDSSEMRANQSPPLTSGEFEAKYNGKEYQLIRQLDAFKQQVPTVELVAEHWNHWPSNWTGSPSIWTDGFSWIFIGWASAMLFLFFKRSSWELAATDLEPRSGSWRTGSAGVPTFLASVVCAYWALMLLSAHYFSNRPMTNAATTVQVRASVKQASDALHRWAAENGYESASKRWSVQTVPKGERVADVEVFHAWKDSPFESWRMTTAGLQRSFPHIAVQMDGTDKPAQSEVMINPGFDMQGTFESGSDKEKRWRGIVKSLSDAVSKAPSFDPTKQVETPAVKQEEGGPPWLGLCGVLAAMFLWVFVRARSLNPMPASNLVVM